MLHDLLAFIFMGLFIVLVKEFYCYFIQGRQLLLYIYTESIDNDYSETNCPKLLSWWHLTYTGIIQPRLYFIDHIFFLASGQVSLLSDKFVFPLYAENNDCDISVEFNTMSFSSGALAVTMTTNYNETYVNVLDKAPFVLPLKQFLSFNVTKG